MNNGLGLAFLKDSGKESIVTAVTDSDVDLPPGHLLPELDTFQEIRSRIKRFYIQIAAQTAVEIVVYCPHLMSFSGKGHCGRPSEIAITT
jgi:hypothetical protein